MKNIFEHTSAPWVHYSSYEYVESEGDGIIYLTASGDAKPEMYNPMRDAGQLVIDAINIGLSAIYNASKEELMQAVLDFVNRYGLLGLMTALPTTADFIQHESVYLPKNHFIREETLTTEDYLDYFFPFEKPDFRKKGLESSWSVSDRYGMAVVMAMGDAPQAVSMGFQREYAERYD